MSWLSLFLVTVLVCGIVLADPSVDDSNQEQSAIKDEVDAEGRNCKGSCGNSGSTHQSSSEHEFVSIKPAYDLFGLGLGLGGGHSGVSGGYGGVSSGGYGGNGGLGGLAGLGGLGGLAGAMSGLGNGFFTLPLLAVNIAILVLLGILLAHVKHFSYGGSGSGTGGDVFSFADPAFVGSGPGLGHGGIGGGPHVVSSYQGYDNSAYHKRSTEEARSMASPSMLSYLTKMATDAIIKYAEIDQDEE